MVRKVFILKLEPDLDPKPEKLCEHGASTFPNKFQMITKLSNLHRSNLVTVRVF